MNNSRGALCKIGKFTLDKILLNQRMFVYIYFTVCLLLSFPVLSPYINYPSKLCFFWAIGLILYDVFKTRRIFRMSYWIIPLLFLCVYAFSVLLNSSVLSTGCKHLIHCAIFMLLIFETHVDATPERILKTTKKLFQILTPVIFLASLISIILFTLVVTVKVNGYKVGFWENRLYGIYFSPNPGALLAQISIIASVMLMIWSKKRSLIKYIACALNIFVQAVYFSLTLSKAGSLAVITFASVFGVFGGIALFRRKCKTLLAIPAALLATVLSLLIIFNVVSIIRKGMVEIPSLVYELQQSLNETPSQTEDANSETQTSENSPETSVPAPTTKENPKEVVLERVENGKDISNSRFDIWLGAIKVAAHNPLFGLADVTTEEMEDRYDYTGLSEKEKSNFVRANGYLHNVYVQIFACSGFLGLLAFLLLALLVAIRLAKTLILGNPNSWMHTLLALLFAFCAMLAVNGFVESHLLFNRQDSIGFLFWFFLGSAVSLEKAFRQSPEYNKEKSPEKFAFVASTPLQVLHSTEFVGNNLEGSAGCSDLYIVHSFGTADKVSEGAKRSGIFNHVYDLKPGGPKNKIASKLSTFYDLFFPKQSLSKKSCGDKIPWDQKHYEYVCASSQTTFTIGVRLIYPDAKVYLYDDGIGSYYGSMVYDYNSKLFVIMNSIFFNGKLFLEPDAMYLAVPAFCKTPHQCPKRNLPTLPEDKIKLLEEIFDYLPNALYQERKLVYLTQPYEDAASVLEGKEQALIRFLEAYEDNAIARVHPRQNDTSFGKLKKDTYKNLWEMECLKQITDESVLISFCSTAQFMPKLLKDSEPYVIFLYKIFKAQTNETLLDLVQRFIKMHRQPERIFIPETLDELKVILDTLMSKQ